MTNRIIREHGYAGLAIVGFGIAGTAARIALTNCTRNWFPQYSTCAENVIGSLIMGMCVGFAPLRKLSPDLSKGLTVGFCGCLTTFCTWVIAIMHNADALIDVVAGIALPLVAFWIGRDATKWIHAAEDSKGWFVTNELLCVVVLSTSVISLTVIGVLGGTPTVSTGDVITCSLSPIGSLSRWFLATVLNDKWGIRNFAVGTFVANMVAVLIGGALTRFGDDSDWSHYVITGICGSLSTVSGWISDTVIIYEGRSKLGAYTYSLGTLACGTLIMVPFIV